LKLIMRGESLEIAAHPCAGILLIIDIKLFYYLTSILYEII